MAKEYIERDALLDALYDKEYTTLCPLDEVSSVIDALPAADVAEVKHGYWVGLEYDGYADGCPVYDLWECSECGEEVSGEDVPMTHLFCYDCGAKMDRSEKHHD